MPDEPAPRPDEPSDAEMAWLKNYSPMPLGYGGFRMGSGPPCDCAACGPDAAQPSPGCVVRYRDNYVGPEERREDTGVGVRLGARGDGK